MPSSFKTKNHCHRIDVYQICCCATFGKSTSATNVKKAIKHQVVNYIKNTMKKRTKFGLPLLSCRFHRKRQGSTARTESKPYFFGFFEDGTDAFRTSSNVPSIFNEVSRLSAPFLGCVFAFFFAI